VILRSDYWPERPVEGVDTKRQRLFDDPGLGNREPRAPTPRHEEAQTEQVAQPFHSDEGPVLFWATIRLRNGKLLNRATRRSAVAAGWHREPILTVVEHGTGTPPWETRPVASQAAPARRPVLIERAVDATGATAPDGVCLTPRDSVEAFEAAASAEAAPVPTVAGATASDARAEITDELIARCLGHLAEVRDVRVRTEVRRLKAVLAELRENGGVARHVKYRIPDLGRAGF
jgi:hypothetical protein